MGLFKKLSQGLLKTRERVASTLAAFGGAGNGDKLEMLEELLYLADVGPRATARILAAAQGADADLLTAVREEILAIFATTEKVTEGAKIKIFVGINGTGKTTSVAKYAHWQKEQGNSVLVVGADTFRAAADQQLEIWCQRHGLPCIIGRSGSDPAAVIYDALSSVAARRADVIICDTAGRLHVNKNLMQELEKLVRVARKFAPVDVYLTLDAGMGQNAIEQVRIFRDWVAPNGIILTKLDGSARGGVAIALAAEFKIPLLFLGVGETVDDLIPFDAQSYVQSLLPEDLVDGLG